MYTCTQAYIIQIKFDFFFLINPWFEQIDNKIEFIKLQIQKGSRYYHVLDYDRFKHLNLWFNDCKLSSKVFLSPLKLLFSSSLH